MLFKNISRWKISKELDGLLFFAQRINELLFDYTLDTYKPPALNAPYLAEEAIQIINDIEAGIVDDASLAPILEELKWAIQNDTISKKLLDIGVEYYIQDEGKVKLAERKLRLEVLAKTLEPHRYFLACINDLNDAIKSNSKKKIDQLARNLATTLINMGVSKQQLFDIANEFFFSSEGDAITSSDSFIDFAGKISPISHTFDLYFIASDLIRGLSDSASAFDVEILDALPIDVMDAKKEAVFNIGEGEVCVHINDIRAYDKYSARSEAERTLGNLSNLLTVFHHKERITWRPLALSNQCCSPGLIQVHAAKSAMDKATDLKPNKASKELNRLISNLPINHPSSARLMRVVDLHGICVSHTISENQLVNIWTALETLIPSNLGSTKIANITNAMLPFLMKAYISKIIEQFTFDLLRWDKWRSRKMLRKVPALPGSSLVVRATNLLAIGSNQKLREDLYDALKDFHLLRYRAFQLAEIISNPTKIKELLDTHEKKLRWQIRRIYRTRNQIVHSGGYPKYLPILIENGHQYLDQILFDLFKTACGEYKTESIEQAFEIAKVLQIKFNRQLSETTEFTMDNTGFLTDASTMMRE